MASGTAELGATAATGAPTEAGLGVVDMVGSGGFGAPEAKEATGGGGIGGFGGGGIVEGAPAETGRGLGGRLTEPSLGLGEPGMPSLRGGRTMRTVSFFGSGDFFGSFMVEETYDIATIGYTPVDCHRKMIVRLQSGCQTIIRWNELF